MLIGTARAFGERLQLIGFIPTLLAVLALLALSRSGAPAAAPGAQALLAAAAGIGAAGVGVAAGVAVAVSVTLQPLQFRLVQVLEGYWTLRGTGWLFRAGVARQRRRRRRAAAALVIPSDAAGVSEPKRRHLEERAQQAETVLRERFPTAERLLPTALGNALRAAEDRAGARYGADSVVVWPRLFPLLPERHADAVEDEVTQLDVSARLAVTWSLAAWQRWRYSYETRPRSGSTLHGFWFLQPSRRWLRGRTGRRSSQRWRTGATWRCRWTSTALDCSTRRVSRLPAG